MSSKPIYDAAEQAGRAILKQITQPLPTTDRRRIIAAEAKMPPTPCPHPVNAIDGIVDYGPASRTGREMNVFVCRLCGRHLFLTDAQGKWASDAQQ